RQKLLQAYTEWHRRRGLAPTLAALLAAPSRHPKAAVEAPAAAAHPAPPMPSLPIPLPTVTVILNVYEREVLPDQLAALLGQTAAARILEIWVCAFSAPAEAAALRAVHSSSAPAAAAGIRMRVIVSDYNFKFYGRFQVALTAPTDFVWLLDDDMMPGEEHLANLLHAAGTELLGRTVLGSIGRVLPRPRADLRLDSYRVWGTHGGLYLPEHYFHTERAVPVDYLCSQWFLRPEWLQYMWAERPQTFKTGEDFHVSHMLRKYAQIGSYVMPYEVGNHRTMGSTESGGGAAGGSAAAWKVFFFSPLLGCVDLMELWGVSAEEVCAPNYMRFFGPDLTDPAAAALPGSTAAAPSDGWTYMRGMALTAPDEWEARVKTNLRHILHTTHARLVLAAASGRATAAAVAAVTAAATATAAAGRRAATSVTQLLSPTLVTVPGADLPHALWTAALEPIMALAWHVPKFSI
ncbi:unnamed protein product, partial [Phaeothamnion confervicola]